MSEAAEPQLFGRYQLLEPLSKGGMGEVFKARMDGAAGTEKLVCIKRILPHLSKNSEFISLFVKEAKVALPLTHGNITQVFDFGELDGIYFLAMEYIRGPNLAKILERAGEGGGRLDLASALWVGAEICRGLQYAHSYTDADGKSVVVVHRDVTPHNVLISYNGEVKLTDFGIALAASRAAKDEEVMRGKPCYLSPEQVAGNAGDPRSDVYALGTTLYEMLTGIRPFEGDSDSETLDRVKSLTVEPPSEHNASVSKELDAIVLKAIARDPAERYQRAGDLQVELSKQLHEIDASYTAEKLAAQMRELFAWELAQEQGKDGAKDRLLFQLSRAGVKVDSAASTEELLQMGTVAIDTTAKPMPSQSRSKAIAALSALAVLIVGVGLFFVFGGSGSSGASKQDAQALLAGLPTEDPTDHVTPKSQRSSHTDPPAPALPSKKPATKGAKKAKPAKKNGSKTSRKPRTKNGTRIARRAVGYLNCNSWPWSVVYLNGKRLRGNTPLYRIKVSVGKHRLRFENPELQLSKEVRVTVGANQVKTVAVSLQN
jgi:serine/threonine protein kinase